jgi:hypothetical protein
MAGAVASRLRLDVEAEAHIGWSVGPMTLVAMVLGRSFSSGR